MLSMYEQIAVKILDQQQIKKAAIARQLKCHRNTVTNILKRETLKETQLRNKPSVFLPYKEQIKKWLEEDELTRVVIHEKLDGEYHVKGSYDALRRFIKKHVPQPVKAYGVQEHLPGDEVETDFGDLWVYLEDEQKKIKFQLLGFILPFSGKRYTEICDNQKLETFLTGFEHAFEYYGGVPKKAKTDNLKPAVTKNTRHELVFNQTFLEFSSHYGFIPNPCTPYEPQQKGAVEGTVKYAQNNFAPGRRCKNREDARAQLKAWLEKVNAKIHGTYKQVINERFERLEKEKLQPLRTEKFSFFHQAERVVGINCHINHDNNYYSVPFSYVKKTVTVRWNQHLLRIVYGGEELALHKLCTGQGNFSTVREHLPPDKIYSETEYQLRHETRMRKIGTNAHHYFIMLLKKQPRQWRQTIRSLYKLAEDYGPEAVDLALGRALSYGAMDTGIVRNILKAKLYETLDQVVVPAFADTGNSRELSYYCLPTGTKPNQE